MPDCPVCQSHVELDPQYRFYPHKRFADGTGVKTQPWEFTSCEGSGQYPPRPTDESTPKDDS